MADYYLGVIVGAHTDEKKGITKEYHVAKVNIPQLAEDIIAFPKCGDNNEPKVGDPVLCLDLDPIYHSYFIYEPIKEDDVIGIRSSGKAIDITPDKITVAVYKKEDENKRKSDNSQKGIGEFNILSKIEMDKDGNIKIYASKNLDIQVEEDVKITAKTVTVNTGMSHDGAVNIKQLKEYLNSIHRDLLVAKSGANLGVMMNPGSLSMLEDKKFKH